MYRSLWVGIIFLVFLTFFTTAAWAETMQAKVTADEVSYDYESKQVEATGNVKIEYKNVKVESDYALIDQEQDVLLATGKVVVHNNGNVYHGDKFLYYLKTQQGWVSPMDSEITDPDINGPVRLTAAEAFIKGEELRTKHSSLTSCDLEHPHYHFSAKEIEYYPDDLIIMRHVWYFEHRVPIFYLPILYISLKKDNFAVSYGFSDSEGWFVDADYYYYFPEDYSYGKIKTRLTEYGGDYIELDHSKYTSHTGIFTQEYGLLDKSNMTNSTISSTYNNNNYKYSYNDTPYFHDAEYGSPKVDYMVGFDYKENLNPKIVTEQEISSWRHFTQNGDSYLDNRYSLNLTSQTPYPTIALKISDLGEQTYRTIDFKTNWQYNPDNTSTINLNGDLLYLGPKLDPETSTINKDYTLGITKNWGWSNVRITANDYENYNNDQTSSNNKLPEIIYTIPDYKAPIVGDVAITTAYTHLEQFSSSGFMSDGERYGLDIHKLPNVIYKQGQITLNNDSTFWYRDFFITQDGAPKTETELYAANTKLNFIDQFTKVLSTTVSLGYTDTEGIKNSFFGYDGDNVDPGAFIQNRWDWNGTALRANLSAGYNFNTRLCDPITMNADWTPDLVARKESLHFDTSYDWYLGLGQTDFNINYNPKKNWLLQLGLSYNPQNSNPWGRRSFLAQIQDRLSTNWEYSINAQYEDLYNKFTQAQIGLTYDWHCRKVFFTFDILQQEFWIQISINAFPSANLKLDSKNTVENLINDINSELQLQ